MANQGFTRMNNEVMRIVMVGKTGNGKSATGNTILGRQCFESRFSPKSITVECTMGKATVDGQQVVVIDTPGLCDTRFDKEQTTKLLNQCVSFAAPGPHIFLVVIRLGRFTKEEKETVQKIQEVFGQAADKYSMVLFTHEDQLKGTTVEKFLGESPELLELVAKCNNQYHVFNNEKDDHSQVTELLLEIRNIVQKNGGSHYTNEMFQEAERAIEEKKQRILKEKEDELRREQEEMERKVHEKYEKETKRINQKLQAEREKHEKEREEERKRIREEMNEDRKREREEREAERQREREERERETQNMLNQLNAQHEKDLKSAHQILKESLDRQARLLAELRPPPPPSGPCAVM